MDNKYKIISKLLDDDSELLSAFVAIKNNVTGSKLLEELIEFLGDDNLKTANIHDNNKVSLVSLMRKYFLSCGDTFMTDDINLEKLVDAAKQDIYHISAPLGFRVATSQEVENGVRGLVAVERFNIDEEKYKLLNLLLWTITGRLRYYSRSGHRYNYESDVGLTDNIYEMIARSAESLNKMMRWVGNKTEFNRDMQVLKNAAKNKYRYPEYAEDEITEDITIKQLLFYLDGNLPRGSDNQTFREAISLVIKHKNNKYFKLSPDNISRLREAYDELTSNPTSVENSIEDEESHLKEECERLLRGRDMGMITGSHFAFKIISTLKKFNYRSCSSKQYEIIQDALGKLSVAEHEKEQMEDLEKHTKIIDVDEELAGGSLVDISNALGDGDFEI